MSLRPRPLLLYGVVLAMAAVALMPRVDAQSAAAPSPPSRPRLVVLLAVDQLRADYVPLYGTHWKAGLHEIFNNGAYFTESAYPHAGTKTCAGHATIGTGTFPSTHGMIDNEWYDAGSRAFVTCTEDRDAESMRYPAGRGTEHHSAARLLVATLAEQVARPRGRIVSVSGKARSAIALGGRGGPNAIILWQEEAGSWATSTKLARLRAPEVVRFIKARPALSLGSGSGWGRFLPEAAYRYDDNAKGEPAANVFPHVFGDPIRTSRTTQRAEEFWARTPALDSYLGALAGSLVTDLGLGQRANSTDVLAIGFSALDLVGHTYGPRSHEVQDTLARLDETIGRLLSLLDRAVGRGHYVLALSADHGVSELPEQAPDGADAGRIATLLPTGTAIDAALRGALGPGRYVEAISGSHFYFRPGVLERIRAHPAAVAAVESVVLRTAGIQHAYWDWDLSSSAPTDDALLTRLRRSHMRGRSGDLAVVVKPGWVLGTGANHGSPHDYDARVPVVFYGAGIRAGRHASAATPVDIAPTLAHLAGVRLKQTDGRILRDALARPEP